MSDLDLSSKVTVVVKTFERPDMISRCVASVRRLHPTLPIIIADDSEQPTLFDGDQHTCVLELPFDTGISAGRNRAIELVTTPYYILIDDDHVFEKDANIESIIRLMDENPFDVVAFRMLDYRHSKGYCRGELLFAGNLDTDGGVLRHTCGNSKGWYCDHPLYDIVLNCYVGRTSNTERLKFDEAIKIGKEHGDYFLSAKELGYKVTVANNAYIHHRPVYTQHYRQFRRRSDIYKQYFYKKWNLHGEECIGGGYPRFSSLRYLPQKLGYFGRQAAKLLG
ncbi:glycosyltransferase family 2 protein [Rhodobacteraceae bacterium RKSG542]|uniref:glycosyltransferase family 2 protein n=1 Tax=Pseudovibrio flavus TaxID=2529854 RepID=UPI0012BD4C3E|nr:glycosyltransferase family 2 protein [Pseudovibrio flavus]MTI18200.1 glycosyltransferase family 2 protein [Pseudovibrio flavus]